MLTTTKLCYAHGHVHQQLWSRDHVAGLKVSTSARYLFSAESGVRALLMMDSDAACRGLRATILHTTLVSVLEMFA